jgi:NADPH2:quinone reductase
MQALRFRGAGGAEVMALEQMPDPQPGSREVTVAVRWAGLNPADLAQRAGEYPPPPGAPADVPGIEVAGTVVATGADAGAWTEGDRVLGLVGGGGLASRVLVHERCLARLPASLAEREAAAVPEAFITAHDALLQAGARAGETVLVTGATGAVGAAAIQLARELGAGVVGVARSEAGRAFVRSLGAHAIGPKDLADGLPLAGTDGADVAIELVGGPSLPSVVDVLALHGRVVLVGIAGGEDVHLRLLAVMRKRARLIGTQLRVRPLDEKAAAVAAFERDVVPALASGSLRTFIDSVFPAAQAPAAFERLASAGRAGKVLLEFDDGDLPSC